MARAAHGPLNRLTEDLKAQLENLLNGATRTGSFLWAFSLDRATNPGLHIPGLGPVPLPLTPDAAQSLIRLCRASPYGKGSETLVDESVRKTWELNANQVSLRNPAWGRQLDDMVKAAMVGLGLDANPQEVRAELYKVLVYEEGAFFLPHQDSEKADGMFGTMVVSLPSKHEGGDVVATHQGKKKVFQTAANSEYGFSCAAWYADVTHEIQPVTSGYRVVLTYNLIHRPLATIVANRGNLAIQLGAFLEMWRTQCNRLMSHFLKMDNAASAYLQPAFFEFCPTSLVYTLDHMYSIAELSFARLKGADRSRVRDLQTACETAGFRIFLANIEKVVSGGVDEYNGYDSDGHHSIMDEIENEISLLNIVDPAGNVLMEKLHVQDFLLTNENTFKDRDPDSEDFSGFTGNEGAHATHYYRQTGVLIVPEEFFFPLMRYASRHGQLDFTPFLEDLLRAVQGPTETQLARQQLRQICQELINNNGSGWMYNRNTSEFMISIARISLETAELDLFHQCVNRLKSLPPSLGPAIGKTIFTHGLSPLRMDLDHIFSTAHSNIFNNLQLLSNIFSTYCAHPRSSFQDHYGEVVEWQDSVLSGILSTVSQLKESDGSALARVLQTYPIVRLLERLIPFLKLNATNTAFIVAFLTTLHETWEQPSNSPDCTTVFSAILPTTVAMFRILESANDKRSTVCYSRTVEREYGVDNFMKWENLLKLIQQCHESGIDHNQIFNAVILQVSHSESRVVGPAFRFLLLPLATALSASVYSDNGEATLSATRQDVAEFLVRLIEAYLTSYVKPRPLPPANWARSLPGSRGGCSCDDCRHLRKFVEDPRSQVGEFPMAEKRRRHLECRLDYTFRYDTIRQGPPHILRVTKTNRLHQRDLAAWKERAERAKLQLRALPEQSPSLIQLIGEATYEKFLDHPNFQSAPPTNTATSAAPAVSTGQMTNTSVTGDSQGGRGRGSASSGLPRPAIPTKRSYIDLSQD